jgi:excisionase family DNA binding protein
MLQSAKAQEQSLMSRSIKEISSTTTAASTASPAQAMPLEILTVEQVAALLQVSPKTIYAWTRRRQGSLSTPIPFHRAGKHLRFERNEVLGWFMGLGKETTVGRPFGIPRPPKKKSEKLKDAA